MKGTVIALIIAAVLCLVYVAQAIDPPAALDEATTQL